MAAGPELREYNGRIEGQIGDLRTLRGASEDLNRAFGTAGSVIGFVSNVGGLVEDLTQTIERRLNPGVDLAKLAPPVTAAANTFDNVLKAILPTLKRLDDVFSALNETVIRIRIPEGAGPNHPLEKRKAGGAPNPLEDNLDLGMLDILAELLEVGQEGLNAIEDRLEEAERELGALALSTDRFIVALDAATSGDFGDDFDALRDAVDAQAAPLNDAAALLEPVYDTIVGLIGDLNDTLDGIDFDLGYEAALAFDQIKGIFEVVDTVLSVVTVVLRPIQPLLDAVSFIFSLIVDPVLDFIVDELGLTDILEGFAQDILDLIPGQEVFDQLQALGGTLADQLSQLAVEFYGVGEYAVDILGALNPDEMGDASEGPTGLGTEEAETLRGDAGDDILDARAGDDRVEGGAGNDVFVASEGEDTVVGGAGVDMIYFSGFFDEYVLARNEETREIVVTHLEPLPGTLEEGSETFAVAPEGDLSGVEHVVFRNIAFTGAELDRALFGGSPLNGDVDGTPTDDLIFLSPEGTPIDGFFQANGLAGDDKIFGTPRNDELNGGRGDDVLLPGGGDDRVNGGAGIDTFQLLANGSNTPGRYSLLEDFAISGAGRDTMTGIENLVVQLGGDHRIVGDGSDNVLISGEGRDAVGGGAGDDTIQTGDERDIIFAGDGADVVYAGARNDLIFAAGAADPDGDFYDGGEGQDTVSYVSTRTIVDDEYGSNRGFEINQQQAANFVYDETVDEATAGRTRVRIDAVTGRIEHLDDAGNVVAVDEAVNVEVFQGSNGNDTITGAPSPFRAPTAIAGGPGDDLLIANGAGTTFGDQGDDTLVASATRGTGSNIYDGGGGIDFLDISQIGELRWRLDIEGSIGRSISGFDAAETRQLNQAANVYRANVTSIETYVLGDLDDEVDFRAGNSGTLLQIEARGGDDYIFNDKGDARFLGQEGSDSGLFQDGGLFSGGAGSDTVTWDTTATNSVIDMGADADLVELERFRGVADGGDGFDVLYLEPRGTETTDLDLAAGTVTSSEGRLDATVTGFEDVRGTDNRDTLRGSDGAEALAGRGGADLLEGRGEDDSLFGGTGDDTLRGGAGNDLLQGGSGDDLLDGGAGRDAVSFAFAVPDAADGGVTAGNFAGVTVDLTFGTATGHGTDQLISIENVFGTGAADRITGDAGGNLLSGLDGNDRLVGLAGDDVLLTGAGNDTVNGGAGDDTVLVGPGRATIEGGEGFDRLDFGANRGTVAVDFAAGTYSGLFDVLTPVWADDGTTGTRRFGGADLTPDMVQESDPLYADSSDDLSRALPDEDDPEAGRLAISLVETQVEASGRFSGIEEVVGGSADVTLILSGATDRYDGTRSEGDRLDFSGDGAALILDAGTGESNREALRGDVLRGIDLFVGTNRADRITGTDGAEEILGLRGADTLRGGGGDDTLEGGGGTDLLEGGQGDDLYRIESRDDRVVEARSAGDDTIVSDGTTIRLPTHVEHALLEGGGRANIFGNGGDNDLTGNRGANILVGGGGDDTATGGGGADTFAFLAGGRGVTTITDFSDGDRIALDDRFFGLGDGGVDPRDVTPQQFAAALRSGQASYSGATGELRIDRDGARGPDAPQLILVLEGGGRLGLDDVLLF